MATSFIDHYRQTIVF